MSTEGQKLSLSAEHNFRHSYMMLGRLKMDLDYYFGCGNKVAKHLYYDTIEEHIEEVKKLLASFPDKLKPEWFTEVDVVSYERRIAEDKMLYSVIEEVDGEDVVLEDDLTLSQAETRLCWHCNSGADAYLQEKVGE